ARSGCAGFARDPFCAGRDTNLIQTAIVPNYGSHRVGSVPHIVTRRAMTLFCLVLPVPDMIKARACVAAILSDQSRMVELDARIDIRNHDSAAGGGRPDLVGADLGNIPFDALC